MYYSDHRKFTPSAVSYSWSREGREAGNLHLMWVRKVGLYTQVFKVRQGQDGRDLLRVGKLTMIFRGRHGLKEV